MIYSELTRRYFDSAGDAAGVLTGPGTFRGAAGSRGEGTWVQFDLQVESGKVQAARFLAFACPHVIAVSAWIVRHGIGRGTEGLLPESVQSLAARFGVPVEKLGRLLLVEDACMAAVKAAIESRR